MLSSSSSSSSGLLRASQSYFDGDDASPYAGLDERQRHAVRLIVDERQNIFLTGQAGVGKTRVVAAVVEAAKQRGLCVALTATTGLAASNLANALNSDE